jgi:hypothetical protein
MQEPSALGQLKLFGSIQTYRWVPFWYSSLELYQEALGKSLYHPKERSLYQSKERSTIPSENQYEIISKEEIVSFIKTLSIPKFNYRI